MNNATPEYPLLLLPCFYERLSTTCEVFIWMPFRETHIKVHPELYIPLLTQPIRNAAHVPFHEVGCAMLIWSWVVKDSCRLSWSALVVLCDGGSQIWFWWSGHTMFWFGGSTDLVWGRTWWTACYSGLVLWSNLDVFLRQMVWPNGWKIKRWEAEEIVLKRLYKRLRELQ